MSASRINHLQFSGVDPGFFERGAPKLMTDRTSGPVGTGGVWGGCAPIRSGEKFVIFKVSSHDLVHSFCLGRPHKVRCPISSNPPLFFVTRDISTHWVLKALLCDSRSTHIGNTEPQAVKLDQKYERIPILRCRRKPECPEKTYQGGYGIGKPNSHITTGYLHW